MKMDSVHVQTVLKTVRTMTGYRKRKSIIRMDELQDARHLSLVLKFGVERIPF